MLPKLTIRKGKTQSWKQLMNQIKEAKKDPGFRRELKQFIKITTS